LSSDKKVLTPLFSIRRNQNRTKK